jgi:hypothetical protein
MRRVKCLRRSIAVAIPAGLYVAAPFMPNAAFTTLCFHTPFDVAHTGVFRCVRYFFLEHRWDLSWVCYASGWMANPALWCAILFIAIGWRRMAVFSASAACLLALVLFWNGTWFILFPAFWFWSASMIAALLCAWYLLKTASPLQDEDYGPLKIREQKQ